MDIKMKKYIEKIKQIKKEKNISYPEIAKMMGIKNCTLQKWIYGGANPTRKNKTILEAFINNNTKENETFAKEVVVEEQKETVVVTRKNYNNRFEVVKLETVEEIVDAINNGEVLISDNFLIKNEKGIIVKYDVLMKPLFINPALDFSCEYTVRRKKPIVLSVLKRFKDKEGSIWYVFKEDSDLQSYEALNEENGVIRDFHKNGFCFDSETTLVEEL